MSYSFSEPEWPHEQEVIADLIAREPAPQECTCHMLPYPRTTSPGPSDWCPACQAEYNAWLTLTEDEFLPLEEVLSLTPHKPALNESLKYITRRLPA